MSWGAIGVGSLGSRVSSGHRLIVKTGLAFALAAPFTAGMIGCGGSEASDPQAIADLVHSNLQAIAAGDADAVCAQYTEDFQAELVADVSAAPGEAQGSCSAAVERI